MEIMIWDPSKGEDYLISDIRTKQQFSSCQLDCLAIEITGDFPWCDKFQDLDDLFDKTSKVLLFSIVPWGDRDKLKAAIEGDAEFIFEGNREIHGYFVLPFKISSLLKIWNKMGGFSSGEWVLAGVSSGCYSEDDMLNNIPFSLNDAPDINFVLELSEMNQSLLLIKKYKDSREIVNRFLFA